MSGHLHLLHLHLLLVLLAMCSHHVHLLRMLRMLRMLLVISTDILFPMSTNNKRSMSGHLELELLV